MATGFVQRWKGKVAVVYGGIWQGGVQSAATFINAGVPTSGTTGTLANVAGPGALLLDSTNKSLYQNTNTLASPTWTAIDIAGSQQAGSGTASYKAAGNISVNLTDAVSAATNTTQTLMSYSLPLNSLDANGRGIVVKAWGIVAGNAAPRNIILNVGGKTLATGSQTQNGVSWQFEGRYYRVAANSQYALLEGNVGVTTLNPSAVSDTSVDTGAITVSVTTVDASAAATNVTQKGMVIEYFGN